MEDLPIEVIGIILSRVGAARDLVVASLTCWQQAWCHHVHTLAFDSNDWPVYDELTKSRLEVIITRTIFQTKALQCLSISLKNNVEFSAAPVIAWLMYTRDTLRQLHYNMDIPDFNIIEVCGRKRLELLDLADNTITISGSTLDLRYQKFSCLRSLSLTSVRISPSGLNALFSACPKVEALNLVNLDFGTDGPEFSICLRGNSLKDARFEAIQFRKICLKADSLEKLHLKDCGTDTFELTGEGTLRILVWDKVTISHLDIGRNAENLEIVDVRNIRTSWSDFYHMIEKSSKARMMSLCSVIFEDYINVFMDSAITACFPQLTHLSLSFELGEAFQCGLLGNRQLENVVEVELIWKWISQLQSRCWVWELLLRCPKLRKLVIGGDVPVVVTKDECLIVAKFTSFINTLSMIYPHVAFQCLV